MLDIRFWWRRSLLIGRAGDPGEWRRRRRMRAGARDRTGRGRQGALAEPSRARAWKWPPEAVPRESAGDWARPCRLGPRMTDDTQQDGGAESSSDMDQRSASDRRDPSDRRQQETPVDNDRRAGPDRRTAQRRKRRGPNQYELSKDEIEFISAIGLFKEQTGRPFPTWSEVLRIVRALGYEKRTDQA